jgi:hypothetical protein
VILRYHHLLLPGGAEEALAVSVSVVISPDRLTHQHLSRWLITRVQSKALFAGRCRHRAVLSRSAIYALIERALAHAGFRAIHCLASCTAKSGSLGISAPSFSRRNHVGSQNLLTLLWDIHIGFANGYEAKASSYCRSRNGLELAACAAAMTKRQDVCTRIQLPHGAACFFEDNLVVESSRVPRLLV